MDRTELDRVIRGEQSDISGIVVLEHGAITYENYFNGCGPDNVVQVASVTKSYLSALVGAAIERGLIRSVDQKILDFFPECPVPVGDPRREISLRHLLTMTAPYVCEQEPFVEICASPDWTAFALDQLGGGATGTFRYSSVGAHLVSVILSRATGASACAFGNEVLFGPLGLGELPELTISIRNYFPLLTGWCGHCWVADPQGHSVGGWGLGLSAREMARFGLLYLNHGVWEGKQLIPAAWVAASTQMSPNEYGYFWWLFEDCFCALGDGGNAICCFPERDMVVAITAQFTPPAPGDRLDLIRRHIL